MYTEKQQRDYVWKPKKIVWKDRKETKHKLSHKNNTCNVLYKFSEGFAFLWWVWVIFWSAVWETDLLPLYATWEDEIKNGMEKFVVSLRRKLNFLKKLLC